MSSENPSTADLDQLSQKVTAIERDSMAIGAAMTRGRQFRLGLFVLLLVVVVVFVLKYKSFFEEFTTDAKQEEFLKAAQTTFFGEEDIENAIMTRLFEGKDPETALQDTLTQMAESSGQMVQEIFRAQVEADMGKYTAALHGQKEILARNLEQRLNELVDEHYEKLLSQHEAILRAKFKDSPQFSEDRLKLLIRNLDNVKKDLLKEYYVDELQVQLDLLYDQYENFPIAEAAKPGDPPLEKQLLQKMAEMISLKLSHVPEPATIPPPAPKPEEAKPEEAKPEEAKPAEKTNP